MPSERFITSELNAREEVFEQTLRPQVFADFPGQEGIKERLQIMVEASRQRGEPLAHLLLCGPPGLGKTTLANIIAKARGVNLKSTSGPVIDLLFIDEIHRLPKQIEEYLYSAMEDFVIDIMLEQGVGARSVRLNLARFCLVGATTRQGMLSSPLRSRFMMTCRLDYYQQEELVTILRRSAAVLKIQTAEDGLEEIARRSRGTPRIANNLIRWVRDYSQVRKESLVTGAVAGQALSMLHIDQDGLDEMDNRILEAIIVKFKGRPVGLKSLAVAVGEEEGTIEDVYEPYLIQEGYMLRTPGGRVVTEKAERRFGLKPLRPGGAPGQPTLF